MIKKIIVLSFLVIGIFISSFMFKSPANELGQLKDNNICRKLDKEFLVYVVFVQDKESYEWSDFDITSAIDSVNRSLKWIEQQAKKNNIKIRATLDYFQTDSLKFVYQSLSGGPLKKQVLSDEGRINIDKWTDKIIKKISNSKSKEQFVNNLRDKSNIGSVAVLFMVNNFYKSDYSFCLNTRSQSSLEYSIISSKQTERIAQEILHLYGAPYLYNHISTSDKKDKKQLVEIFPYDIMSEPGKGLSKLNIGEITAYYIGWSEDINAEYDGLVKDEKFKF